MKSLYCKECTAYLMAGSGDLVDCSCGWKQPEDEGIAVDDYEALRKDAERYRWLRDGNNEKNSEAISIAVNHYGDEWDEMIDAAMQGDNPP